jgi:hypothetical protein
MEGIFELVNKCNTIYKNNNNKKNVQSGGFSFGFETGMDLIVGIFAVMMRSVSFVASTFFSFVPRFFTPPVFYKRNEETGLPEFTTPYYPDYLDGYGLFWKFMHICIKISLYVVAGIYGGISFIFLGMLYLFNRLYKELGVFTEANTKL